MLHGCEQTPVVACCRHVHETRMGGPDGPCISVSLPAQDADRCSGEDAFPLNPYRSARPPEGVAAQIPRPSVLGRYGGGSVQVVLVAGTEEFDPAAEQPSLQFRKPIAGFAPKVGGLCLG